MIKFPDENYKGPVLFIDEPAVIHQYSISVTKHVREFDNDNQVNDFINECEQFLRENTPRGKPSIDYWSVYREYARTAKDDTCKFYIKNESVAMAFKLKFG